MESKVFTPAYHANQFMMVDLHRNSPEESKTIVNRRISYAEEFNVSEFRFVTGRGNHPASDGERGKLYQEFLGWISEENHSKIDSIEKCDGYYKIKMKPVLKKGLFRILQDQCNEKIFSRNIDQIRILAEKGDAESQLLLGHCYQHGVGLAVSEKDAVVWYEKAAMQNNAMAQHVLGGCYWLGQGLKQNDKKAIQLFEAAAANNEPYSLLQLGDIYCFGFGDTKDIHKAIGCYEKSGALGLDLSKRRLASIYSRGKGVAKDDAKALSLYKEVADNGDPFAAYNVATFYLHGRGTPKNILLAFRYAQQAADKNDPDGQMLLSLFYRGIYPEIQADQKLCLEYLKRAAENQHKDAFFELARHPSIKVDKIQHMNYLMKAAKAGQIIAQAMMLGIIPDKILFEAGLSPAEIKNISDLFWNQPDEALLSIPDENYKFIVLDVYIENENLTRKQKSKVMRLLNALADQKNPRVFVRLGAAYHQGFLIKSDIQQAIRYFQLGAGLDSASCLCSLGYFAEENKNYEQSFDYHTLAAKKGSANSHNQLAQHYENGWGVEQNIEKAIHHFLEAARLDDPENETKERDGLLCLPVFPFAACNLGMLYWKMQKSLSGDSGDVLEKRKSLMGLSVYWLLKADKAGHEGAGKFLEKIGIPKADLEKNREGQNTIPNKEADKKESYQQSETVNFWKAEAPKPLDQKPVNPIDKLKIFTQEMGIMANWKIDKKIDNAWCYIANDEIPLLERYDISPANLRKTSDGKHILLIERISTQNLEELSPKRKTTATNQGYRKMS